MVKITLNRIKNKQQQQQLFLISLFVSLSFFLWRSAMLFIHWVLTENCEKIWMKSQQLSNVNIQMFCPFQRSIPKGHETRKTKQKRVKNVSNCHWHTERRKYIKKVTRTTVKNLFIFCSFCFPCSQSPTQMKSEIRIREERRERRKKQIEYRYHSRENEKIIFIFEIQKLRMEF